MRILVVSGPNLSQLGSRDPRHYGTDTLASVLDRVRAVAASAGATIEECTSESESVLVARLHAARTDGTAAVIVNAGALTHYSLALRDAIELLDVPVIEVHLSNVHAREDFRHVSVIAGVCDASIVGLGGLGYELAVQAVLALARPGGQ
jgi:3-dehydroquinate dehydratase-2